MNIVLDTNIVISGLFWKGAPRQVLDLARSGIFTLFTSPELLAELVLGYAALAIAATAPKMTLVSVVMPGTTTLPQLFYREYLASARRVPPHSWTVTPAAH